MAIDDNDKIEISRKLNVAKELKDYMFFIFFMILVKVMTLQKLLLNFAIDL